MSHAHSHAQNTSYSFSAKALARRAMRVPSQAAKAVYAFVHRSAVTPVRVRLNARRVDRRLEIGPGAHRVPGFETLNIVAGRNVDYVADASRTLPFLSNTFTTIYASHVLEHVPWYQTETVLREWVRVLRPGGRLEIWVPDGLKICRAFVESEETGADTISADGWYRFNDRRDPCVWAAGRIFSYGDGTGKKQDPNWHLALFSERYLKDALNQVGLCDVARLHKSDVRGYDHGWINLGLVGTKREPADRG
jgi:SAM-dependent methyltransferase